MKARPTKLTIWEIVESHPYLNSEQKKIVKENLRDWIREESDKAIHICCKNYEREVSSQALMALNRGFGFGAIRLQRFVKIFNQLMDKYEEFLCGDESVGAGCYHDLKEQFPNVDEWIGDRDVT